MRISLPIQRQILFLKISTATTAVFMITSRGNESLASVPLHERSFRKKDAKFETKFPNISPKCSPKFGPEFLVLFCWQAEKSCPQISPNFSHQILQISNRILQKLHNVLLRQTVLREGVNREKLTVKKSSITRIIFHRLCPLETVKNSAQTVKNRHQKSTIFHR